MPQVRCAACGRDVCLPAWRLRRGHRRYYCGHRCRRTLVPIRCAGCGRTLRPRVWRSKYCSWACAAPTRLAKGDRPWNRGLGGIHLSPATEFKPGRHEPSRLPVGSIRVRIDGEGRPRAWVKVADPNRWAPRARRVWVAANGPIPAGMVIHHIDHDTMNDDATNLVALTRSGHVGEHAEQIRCSRRIARRSA